MKFPIRLVLRYLTGHPVRTLLTLGSLAVAFFLLSTLRSFIVTLEAGVKSAQTNRLIVQSAVSLFVILPESYDAKIRNVEGVAGTCRMTWFGGYFQDPSNFFGQFGIDEDTLFSIYPEIVLRDGTKEAFLADRRACVVGSALATKFAWKVGDTVPLATPLFARRDGSTWEFHIAGIYHSTKSTVDNMTMFFHHDYLTKGLEEGAVDGPHGVGIYSVKVADGASPQAVMARIDALYENGPQRVQTTTEAEFQAQFVSMVGNIPFLLSAIGGAVFFAILLATLNTLLMSAREQWRDAGILKALGFTNAAVFAILLLESLTLTVAGGGSGVLLALATSDPMRLALGAMFPLYEVSGETAGLGLVLSVLVGLIAGVAPAWKLARLAPVQSLRAEA
jgi:putative ABC transport system permease protein